MGNRKDRKILGGQSRRSSVWMLGVLEKESRENEEKEFIEIMGKISQNSKTWTSRLKDA